jgi:hypothetical protein
MKIGIAIILSAVTATLVVIGVLSLSSGSSSGVLGALPAALLIAVPYVAFVGGAFYALLRKRKKASYLAYAAAGGAAGACYLLVPMVLSGSIGDLRRDFMSFVPFGLTLIISGSIAGMVFRLCVFTYEKKIKAA